MRRVVVLIVSAVLGLSVAPLAAGDRPLQGEPSTRGPRVVPDAALIRALEGMTPDGSNGGSHDVEEAEEPEAVEPHEARPDRVEVLREDLEALRERLEVLEEQVSASLRALHIYELPEAMEFGGEPVPLDRWDVAERLEREFFLSLGDRAQVILWLKRSARYFPYIEGRLGEAHLPDDLKYVAVIESALLPRAYSRARALGIWQFVASTGRRYGLKITRQWDERRNPERSTAAALAYLSDLHKRFRDWPLALAGYNLGEDRVERARKRQGVSSYYQLALPAETERYVFRVLAAKLILSNPERYGFQIPDEQLYHPREADVVEVRVRHRLPVRDLATASGSFYREIKALNPEIVRDDLPEGRYRVRVPKGSAERFAGQFRERAPRKVAAAAEQVRYRVQQGDTLSGIAQRFGVSVSALKRSNATARKRFIHPGQTLIIPGRGKSR